MRTQAFIGSKTNSKPIRTCALLLYFCLTLVGCSRNQDERLTITGSSTIAPLASELARHFETLHPDIKVDVQSGGSSRGIQDVRTGLANLGMVSRALRAEEQDLSGHTIAHDGIAMILHRDNPITELSRDQIIALYTNQTNSWAEVGGPEKPVVIVNKADGRSTLELFLNHFQLKSNQVKPDVVIGDNQQGLKTVAGNPLAIAYVSIGSAEYEASQGQPIKLLPLNGIAANTQNVKAGHFPLSRELNLVSVGPLSKNEQAFINFARSQQAKSLVETQFFIPIVTPINAPPELTHDLSNAH